MAEALSAEITREPLACGQVYPSPYPRQALAVPRQSAALRLMKSAVQGPHRQRPCDSVRARISSRLRVCDHFACINRVMPRRMS